MVGGMSIAIESCIGQEAKRLVHKDRQKGKLVASLYAASLLGLQKGRQIRAAYFFMRYLDDLLDGEIEPGEMSPREYASDVLEQLESGHIKPDDRIKQLGAYTLSHLEPAHEVRDQMARILRAMIFDYDRRLVRQTVSSEQLHEYYAGMLDASVDGALTAIGSSGRSNDTPGLGLNLGRLYSLRDLRPDWTSGIINIPGEVLISTGVGVDVPYGEMVDAPGIRTWIHDETVSATDAMQRILRRTSELPDIRARIVIVGLGNGAIRSVRA